MATKTDINRLRSQILLLGKRLERQKDLERKARDSWTKSYHAYMKANRIYMTLKNVNTKSAKKLRVRSEGWEERSVQLTKLRDDRRADITHTEQELIALRYRLAQIEGSIVSRQAQHDDIVDRVFVLNDAVVTALQARNGFLHDQVYGYLVDDKGKLRSQVTFTSSDSKRRVVAMVNSIQVVDTTIVQEAFALIDAFFERTQAITINPKLQPLYDLTRKLLTEKRSFKVGETYTRFMALKLNKKDFRELVEAQELLKQAVRPEKTTSYVRLYFRADIHSNWEAVKLT